MLSAAGQFDKKMRGDAPFQRRRPAFTPYSSSVLCQTPGLTPTMRVKTRVRENKSKRRGWKFREPKTPHGTSPSATDAR